mgnify:CR=1 FL=1
MNFTIGTIENWVANYYGLEVKASELNGYDELNFLLVEKSGKKHEKNRVKCEKSHKNHLKNRRDIIRKIA